MVSVAQAPTWYNDLPSSTVGCRSNVKTCEKEVCSSTAVTRPYDQQLDGMNDYTSLTYHYGWYDRDGGAVGL